MDHHLTTVTDTSTVAGMPDGTTTPAIGAVELIFAGEARGLPAHSAHLVHGWLLDAIGRTEPWVFDLLHAATARRQPFTITARPVPGGLGVLLTWINQLTGSAILKAAHASFGQEVELGRQPLRLASLTAGPTWREALTEPEGQTGPPTRHHRTVALTFQSPTMFRHQAHDLLFPEPRLVFGSLLRSWNDHCQPRIDPSLGERLLATTVISRYRLATTSIPFPQFPQRGFTGNCVYAFVPWDEAVCQLARLLGEFARFAGVGYKSSMGMGQVVPAGPPTPRRRSSPPAAGTR